MAADTKNCVTEVFGEYTHVRYVNESIRYVSEPADAFVIAANANDRTNRTTRYVFMFYDANYVARCIEHKARDAISKGPIASNDMGIHMYGHTPYNCKSVADNEDMYTLLEKAAKIPDISIHVARYLSAMKTDVMPRVLRTGNLKKLHTDAKYNVAVLPAMPVKTCPLFDADGHAAITDLKMPPADIRMVHFRLIYALYLMGLVGYTFPSISNENVRVANIPRCPVIKYHGLTSDTNGTVQLAGQYLPIIYNYRGVVECTPADSTAVLASMADVTRRLAVYHDAIVPYYPPVAQAASAMSAQTYMRCIYKYNMAADIVDYPCGDSHYTDIYKKYIIDRCEQYIKVHIP